MHISRNYGNPPGGHRCLVSRPDSHVVLPGIYTSNQSGMPWQEQPSREPGERYEFRKRELVNEVWATAKHTKNSKPYGKPTNSQLELQSPLFCKEHFKKKKNYDKYSGSTSVWNSVYISIRCENGKTFAVKLLFVTVFQC